MEQVKIFWDPNGLGLVTVGKKKFLGAADGDTPYVSVPIRMLSVDTPEVHYPGNQRPSRHDAKLAQLAGWMQSGQAPVDDGLAACLQPRLATGSAGTLQETQGERAAAEFEQMVEQKLTRPSGTKRNVFLHGADELFDRYGRLLAYVAASYTAAELASMSLKDRATFNLLMIENGWAASFPIYPSLPRHQDLVLLQQAAKDAYESRRGAWADAMALTGYEFRMCVKLYDVTEKLVSGKNVSARERSSWVERFCADMTTREIFYPQKYYKVKPYNRMFIWPEDAAEAVGKMNLLPVA